MNATQPSHSQALDVRRILVVEEDFTRRHLLVSMLGLRSDVEVVTASAEDAEATALLLGVDAILLNLNATRGSGLELVRRLRRAQRDLTVASIGDDLHSDLHLAAVRAGIRTFLALPLSAESLAQTLDAMFPTAVSAA